MEEQKAIETIFSLCKTTSRKAKENLLKENHDNYLLKRIFDLALSPFMRYHVAKIPKSEIDLFETPRFSNLTLSQALSLLTQLSDRTYTGNAALKHVSDILRALTPAQADIFKRVLLKDMDCGVGPKTVMKIWPDLVLEYPTMKAEKITNKLIDKFPFPCYGQIKADGMRINAIVDGETGEIEYVSRNGLPVDCDHPQLRKQLLDIYETIGQIDRYRGKKYVVDGELVAVSTSTGEPLDRQTSNGICNKAIRGTISVRERKTLKIFAWDLIPHNSLLSQYDDTPYYERLEYLGNSMTEPEDDDSIAMLEVSHTFMIEGSDEATKIARGYIDNGFEGIIVKNIESPWEAKRSKHQLKFKEIKDADVLCVGIEEGQGRRAGMVGALICESADGVKFSVGTGLTDDDLKDPAKFVDKIVEIEYNYLTKNKNSGNYSVFLPVYVRVRHDKHEPDRMIPENLNK